MPRGDRHGPSSSIGGGACAGHPDPEYLLRCADRERPVFVATTRLQFPADLFDPALYAAVRRPLARAETLPAWCYTSPEFYRREVERLFLRGWLFAGREDEVATPGEYLCFDTPGGPALLLRGADGLLRAFANTCRHRGSRLLAGQGACRRVVCPYHSWVYDLDGSLERAQGMQASEGFDAVANGLLALRMEHWAGFVWVSYDDSAPPLADSLGDLPQKFAAHRFEDMVCTRRVHFDIAANWKLVLENAMETYHTGTVHRDTLGRQRSHHEPTVGDWIALWIEGERSIAVLAEENTAPTFDPIPGLAGRAAEGTYFTVLFPCLQFAVAQDCLWWLDVQPQAADRCRLTVGSCFPRATVARPDFEQLAAAYYRRWDAATPEDCEIAEVQQAGLGSALHRPGRFATEEFAVHAFDNWVIERVVDHPRCA